MRSAALIVMAMVPINEAVTYKPYQRYEGNNFFDAFDFFTDDDPTHGWKNMLHFLIIIYFCCCVLMCDDCRICGLCLT